MDSQILCVFLLLSCFIGCTGGVTICEHQSQTISCSSGTISISSANYGRTDGSTCPGSVGTTSCYASSSLSVVQSACHGRSSCTLEASNGVFGDPCVGTFKYLAVSYSCSVNGNWASWGSWGSCPVTCGGSTQSRSRSCTNPAPSGGGSTCSGSSSETQSCGTANCPIHGGYTSWGSWGSCTVTCGGGTQVKTRSCSNPAPQYGGNSCSGSASTSQSCNTQDCPIDGGYTSWTSWGTCTVTCGGGTQVKTRSCTNPAPQYGGASCSGDASATQACNTHNCPIDGAYTAWTAWGTCTLNCGGGTQVKTRTCTNPAPQYGGAQCSGASSESRACNTHNCPIDGVWAAWSSWGTCTVTCGGGTQDRSRTCTSPAPQYGGADCPGDSSSTQDCNTHPCPIDGAWTSWGAWGSCTVTCGGGTQDRDRICSNPTPQHGGADCPGNDTSTQDCNTQVCIIDGAWGAWTAWGTCTVTCGGGRRSRGHTCDDPAPANGGLPCPGDSSEFEDCSTTACPTVAAGTYIQLCPSAWFTCETGSITCIDQVFKCDCTPDCTDGSDETVGYASCSPTLLAACQSAGIQLETSIVVTVFSVLTALLVNFRDIM